MYVVVCTKYYRHSHRRCSRSRHRRHVVAEYNNGRTRQKDVVIMYVHALVPSFILLAHRKLVHYN